MGNLISKHRTVGNSFVVKQLEVYLKLFSDEVFVNNSDS
jgi:hypothetical protein